MGEYIDKSAEVHEGYLTDWYIESVAEYADEKLNEPRWTEAHIEELTNDFIVIPKDTPAADVAPVVHGHWRKSKEGVCGDYLFVCSACGADYWESPSYCKQAHYCPNCGAKMD